MKTRYALSSLASAMIALVIVQIAVAGDSFGAVASLFIAIALLVIIAMSRPTHDHAIFIMIELITAAAFVIIAMKYAAA